MKLKKHDVVPGRKTLLIVGSTIVILTVTIIIILITDPFDFFNETNGIKPRDILGDFALDENANIAPEVAERIDADIADFNGASDEDRIDSTIDYYGMLIDESLSSRRSDYAAILVFREYDYLAMKDGEGAALQALNSVDLSRFDERDMTNIKRIITEVEERLPGEDNAESPEE